MKYLSLLLVLAWNSHAVQETPATDLDKLIHRIKPTPAESSWSSIPWQLDLTAARKKAAAEGKPLFVWTMSGEPLGQC